MVMQVIDEAPCVASHVERCQLVSKTSGSTHTARHRAKAFLTLRPRRSRKPVVFELLESTLSALRAAAGELLSEVPATLGLAG